METINVSYEHVMIYENKKSTGCKATSGTQPLTKQLFGDSTFRRVVSAVVLTTSLLPALLQHLMQVLVIHPYLCFCLHSPPLFQIL